MPKSYRLKNRSATPVPQPRSFFTDGLIVAAATAAAYLITFAYEYGYCAYFGIPGYIIEPTTGTILFGAFLILAVSMFLIDASFLPQELLSALPHPMLKLRIVLVSIICVSPYLLDRPISWLSIIYIITTSFVLLFDYIVALCSKPGSFSQRLSEGEKSTYMNKTAWDGIVRKFGIIPVRVIIFTVSGMWMAWMGGSMHAKMQEGFIVLKANRDFAVIKRYGDRFIAIKYVGSPARATGEFRILDKEKDLEFLESNNLKIQSVRRWRDGENRGIK